MIIFFYFFFVNTIFVSSHMYPENPEGTQVIVGSMNMGYISDTIYSIYHMLDLTVESNHVYTLMKCITQCFIKITMHALAGSYIEKFTGNKVHKQLSKHVHFEHQ